MKAMHDTVILKRSSEIAHLERVAILVMRLLREIKPMIVAGCTTLTIDRFCHDWIIRHRAEPVLTTVANFPGCVCASVNSVAVHGPPNSIPLQMGDIVTIDVSIRLDGWYGDLAWSYIVGPLYPPEVHRLIHAAWQSMLAGLRSCRLGNRISDIGQAIQETARRYGCTVLRCFTGHGIGRAMHEYPPISHIGNESADAPFIVPGMVLNIEPVISLGGDDATLLEDDWSYRVTDGSLSAQFEQTVAVQSNGSRALALDPHDIGADLPPFY